MFYNPLQTEGYLFSKTIVLKGQHTRPFQCCLSTDEQKNVEF